MITVNDRVEFLTELYKHLPENPMGAEIGVFRGGFSRMIFDILSPSYLIAVDPFNTDERKKYSDGTATAYSNKIDLSTFNKELYGERIHNRIGSYVGYSYDAVKSISDSWLDFIYHDASHLYEDIKRDLNDWLPKLKPGGLMCGHDYIQHDSFGVIQAVDEFCTEHNFEMIIFNTNGGDYALRAIQ